MSAVCFLRRWFSTILSSGCKITCIFTLSHFSKAFSVIGWFYGMFRVNHVIQSFHFTPGSEGVKKQGHLTSYQKIIKCRLNQLSNKWELNSLRWLFILTYLLPTTRHIMTCADLSICKSKFTVNKWLIVLVWTAPKVFIRIWLINGVNYC